MPPRNTAAKEFEYVLCPEDIGVYNGGLLENLRQVERNCRFFSPAFSFTGY